MSDNVFDGLYAAPLDILTERGHRWPWLVAAVGTAIVLVGGAAYSGSAEHTGYIGALAGWNTPAPSASSSARMTCTTALIIARWVNA